MPSCPEMLFDFYSPTYNISQWTLPKPGLVTTDAEEQRATLQPLELKLILAIAEEFILKLALFRTRLPEVTGHFDFRFLRDRGDEPYLPPYKPLTKREINLWQWKLAWDLAQLQRVFIAVNDELRTSGTTYALQRFNQHQFDLVLEVKQYEAIIKKLSKTEQIEQRHSYPEEGCLDATSQELNESISLLERKFIETDYKIRIIKEYILKHEHSRIDQNKIKIELIESDLNKNIEDLLNEKEDDELSHKMIMKFLTESIKMLNKKIEYWHEEWKKDMNLRDYEILRLEADMEEQAMKTNSLIIDYGRREREIENYLVGRQERKEQEIIEQHITECTIKIQAWWRGCMVRWKLGPYSSDLLKKKKKKLKKK